MHRHNTVEFQSQVVALAVSTAQMQWFEVHYFLFWSHPAVLTKEKAGQNQAI